MREIAIKITKELLEDKCEVKLTPAKREEAINHFERLLNAGESELSIFRRHQYMFIGDPEAPWVIKLLRANLITFANREQLELEIQRHPKEVFLYCRPSSEPRAGHHDTCQVVWTIKVCPADIIQHVKYSADGRLRYRDPMRACFATVDGGALSLVTIGNRAWPFVKALLETPLSEEELKALLNLEQLEQKHREDPSFVASTEQIKAFIAPAEAKKKEAQQIEAQQIEKVDRLIHDMKQYGEILHTQKVEICKKEEKAIQDFLENLNQYQVLLRMFEDYLRQPELARLLDQRGIFRGGPAAFYSGLTQFVTDALRLEVQQIQVDGRVHQLIYLKRIAQLISVDLSLLVFMDRMINNDRELFAGYQDIPGPMLESFKQIEVLFYEVDRLLSGPHQQPDKISEIKAKREELSERRKGLPALLEQLKTFSCGHFIYTIHELESKLLAHDHINRLQDELKKIISQPDGMKRSEDLKSFQQRCREVINKNTEWGKSFLSLVDWICVRNESLMKLVLEGDQIRGADECKPLLERSAALIRQWRDECVTRPVSDIKEFVGAFENTCLSVQNKINTGLQILNQLKQIESQRDLLGDVKRYHPPECGTLIRDFMELADRIRFLDSKDILMVETAKLKLLQRKSFSNVVSFLQKCLEELRIMPHTEEVIDRLSSISSFAKNYLDDTQLVARAYAYKLPREFMVQHADKIMTLEEGEEEFKLSIEEYFVSDQYLDRNGRYQNADEHWVADYYERDRWLKENKQFETIAEQPYIQSEWEKYRHIFNAVKSIKMWQEEIKQLSQYEIKEWKDEKDAIDSFKAFLDSAAKIHNGLKSILDLQLDRPWGINLHIGQLMTANNSISNQCWTRFRIMTSNLLDRLRKGEMRDDERLNKLRTWILAYRDFSSHPKSCVSGLLLEMQRIYCEVVNRQLSQLKADIHSVPEEKIEFCNAACRQKLSELEIISPEVIERKQISTEVDSILEHFSYVKRLFDLKRFLDETTAAFSSPAKQADMDFLKVTQEQISKRLTEVLDSSSIQVQIKHNLVGTLDEVVSNLYCLQESVSIAYRQGRMDDMTRCMDEIKSASFPNYQPEKKASDRKFKNYIGKLTKLKGKIEANYADLKAESSPHLQNLERQIQIAQVCQQWDDLLRENLSGYPSLQAKRTQLDEARVFYRTYINPSRRNPDLDAIQRLIEPPPPSGPADMYRFLPPPPPPPLPFSEPVAGVHTAHGPTQPAYYYPAHPAPHAYAAPAAHPSAGAAGAPPAPMTPPRR